MKAGEKMRVEICMRKAVSYQRTLVQRHSSDIPSPARILLTGEYQDPPSLGNHFVPTLDHNRPAHPRVSPIPPGTNVKNKNR